MIIFFIALLISSCVLIPGSTGMQHAIQKEMAGAVITGGFLTWWIWRYNKWFAVLVGWCLLRMFFPDDQPRGPLNMVNILMAVMLYLGVIELGNVKEKFYRAICAIGGVHILVTFLQKFNLFMFWNFNCSLSRGRVWGLMGNGNFTGCFIAMTLPIFLWLGERNNKWYYGGAVCGVVSLFLINSTFPLVAGLTGIALYYYLKYRDRISKTIFPFIFLVGVVIAEFYVYFHPIYFYDDFERFETWRRILKLMTFSTGLDWQSHFFQGWGLGSAYMILPKLGYTLSDQVWYQAHNEILQVLMELGVVGVIMACGLVVTTFLKANKDNVELISGLFIILINSMGFFVFHSAPMGYIAVIYLALLDRNQKYRREYATVLQ